MSKFKVPSFGGGGGKSGGVYGKHGNDRPDINGKFPDQKTGGKNGKPDGANGKHGNNRPDKDGNFPDGDGKTGKKGGKFDNLKTGYKVGKQGYDAYQGVKDLKSDISDIGEACGFKSGRSSSKPKEPSIGSLLEEFRMVSMLKKLLGGGQGGGGQTEGAQQKQSSPIMDMLKGLLMINLLKKMLGGGEGGGGQGGEGAQQKQSSPIMDLLKGLLMINLLKKMLGGGGGGGEGGQQLPQSSPDLLKASGGINVFKDMQL